MPDGFCVCWVESQNSHVKTVLEMIMSVSVHIRRWFAEVADYSVPESRGQGWGIGLPYQNTPTLKSLLLRLFEFSLSCSGTQANREREMVEEKKFQHVVIPSVQYALEVRMFCLPHPVCLSGHMPVWLSVRLAVCLSVCHTSRNSCFLSSFSFLITFLMIYSSALFEGKHCIFLCPDCW